MAWIKLSKQNYFHNLSLITARASKEKIAVVLKDNAYGHGIEQIAPLAAEFGITKCVVKSAQEAFKVAKVFPFILILSDKPREDLGANMHLGINELSKLKQYKKGTNVFLKVDTGMHRNGVAPQQLQEALSLVRSAGLNLTGVYSHSRAADELSTEAFWQLKNFESVRAKTLELCRELSMPAPLFSFANSAMLFRYGEQSAFDLARVGIASYGYLEMPAGFAPLELRPVLSLFANRVSTRALGAGARVGYSGLGKIENDCTVSTYDLGYGDGFLRLNKDKILTTPQGYKNIGKMSMDSFSLNSADDCVEIFNDARPIAKIFDTIVYDCLVKLNENIGRVVYE